VRKKGNTNIFFDNLPGYPDSLILDPKDDTFWLAGFGPRVALLDYLHPYVFLKRIIYQNAWIQPKPKNSGFIFHFSNNGELIEYFDNIPSITSIFRDGDNLFLGNLNSNSIYKIKII